MAKKEVKEKPIEVTLWDAANKLMGIPHYSLPLFRWKLYHRFRSKVYQDSGPNFTNNSAAKFTR